MKVINISNDLSIWLRLSNLSQVGFAKLFKIQQKIGNLENLFQISQKERVNLGLPLKAAKKLDTFTKSMAEEELLKIEQENIKIINYNNELYPKGLKQINSPPLLLYIKGNASLLKTNMFAVVGTRHPSFDGKENAFNFAKSLNIAGLTVVSGLALGIDSCAHKGALSAANGKTIAVVGTGLDEVYPRENKQLAKEIINKGAIISEYPRKTPPKAWHFPQRNRIISGLVKGVLVVEAAKKSGSLLTANMALTENREVFAIPGSIHNAKAKGCNSLIKEGAKLVENVEDILEELALSTNNRLELHSPKPNEKEDLLDGKLKEIYRLINTDSIDIDTLSLTTGHAIDYLMPHLLSLELNGYIEPVPGGYVRKKGASHERTCA